jgi:hypothetical protein
MRVVDASCDHLGLKGVRRRSTSRPANVGRGIHSLWLCVKTCVARCAREEVFRLSHQLRGIARNCPDCGKMGRIKQFACVDV